MGEHTPGPWDHETTVLVECKLAPCFAIGNFHKEPDASNSAANARLIAAAPDLLEACRAVYKMMDDEPFDFAIAGEILHAAIQKVTHA